MSEARQTLQQLARRAAEGSGGSIAVAEGRLNSAIIAANDIEIERELTAAFRGAALLACVSQAFAALRAEAHHEAPEPEQPAVAPIPDEHLRTTPEPEPYRHPRYLDTFLVSGKPIGDCTAEEVEAAMRARKRDVRFMEIMIAGVPAGQPIRLFHTDGEAAAAYDLATSEADDLQLVVSPPESQQQDATSAEEPDPHLESATRRRGWRPTERPP